MDHDEPTPPVDDRVVEGLATDGLAVHEIGRRTYVVADVDPLDVDGTRTVAFGTLMFGVGFLVLLALRGRLEASGNSWWIWTCLAGFGLGVVGWDYCRRRKRARQAREDG